MLNTCMCGLQSLFSEMHLIENHLFREITLLQLNYIEYPSTRRLPKTANTTLWSGVSVSCFSSTSFSFLKMKQKKRF